MTQYCLYSSFGPAKGDGGVSGSIEGRRPFLRIFGKQLCRVFSKQDRADLFVVGTATESEHRHQHPPGKNKVVECSREQSRPWQTPNEVVWRVIKDSWSRNTRSRSPCGQRQRDCQRRHPPWRMPSSVASLEFLLCHSSTAVTAEFPAEHDRDVWRCLAEIFASQNVGQLPRHCRSRLGVLESVVLWDFGMRPTGEVRRIVQRVFGHSIHKWPRTSSEECKVECPIVCPQSRIAQHISKTLGCSCQHGKHWQEGPTSN